MRPFAPETDAAALAALVTATGPEPLSEADIRAWLAGANPQTVFSAVIADDGLAYADVYRQPWHPEGEYAGRVLVAPSRRGQGLGTELFGHVVDFASGHGGTLLTGRVRENDADGRRFAERHGFTVRQHKFESIVDLSTLAATAMAEPDPPGVTVRTMDTIGDTEENRREVWRLNEETFADEPSQAGAQPRTYEQFVSQLFETGWWRPEEQFIAVDQDGHWIGLATLRHRPATNSFYTVYTGVGRAYRGRGVASALKRATLRYALEHRNAAFVNTTNDSANAAMLAVNRRFGFRPQPGVLLFARAI